jgi:hypothetical protein
MPLLTGLVIGSAIASNRRRRYYDRPRSRTRVFSGKRYDLYRYYSGRSAAYRAAQSLRNRGSLARVVIDGDGYAVYQR